jgi:predicted HNH restriction endonuclease
MTRPSSSRNIFLAPRSNETAYQNYISSMQGKPRSEIAPFLTGEELEQLGDRQRFFIWGCQPGLKSKWDKLELGDYILFYKQGKFIAVGELLFKKYSEALAEKMWPKNEETNEPWSCVFFVDNLRDISVSIQNFNEMTAYNGKSGYKFDRVQGFMRVDKMDQILQKYGTADNFIATMESGISTEDAEEIIQLAKESPKKISKEGIARFDELTRNRTDEELRLAIEGHIAAVRGKIPEKVRHTYMAIKRRKTMVKDMKEYKGNKCQMCGFTFKKPDGSYYTEAAHVVAISDLKPGVDSPENILILCANHHKMLDYDAIKYLGADEYMEYGTLKKLLVS